MNNYATFGIHFIREGAEGNDDLLTVRPDGNGRYCVQLEFSKVACLQNKGKKNETYMNHFELDNYLQNLFQVLLLDEDPYQYYQIDLPAMPSVIVNQKRLPKIERWVLDQLEDYEMNGSWPTLGVKAEEPIKKEKIRRIIYDENGKPKHMWFA
jgi:hypothetical protein